MYKFDPNGEPPASAFRAIAIDQLDEALSDLGEPDASDRSVVHEARRRTKKLRGLLRLVRAGITDFGQENEALRGAAALLSHLRDREVRRETLKTLAKWRSSPILDRLLAETAEPGLHDDSAALAAFRSRLTEVRIRAERWSLSRPGTETLDAGVRRTYRSGRRRMAKARDRRTPDSFHDWRKSNKNYGFGIDLLKKAAPDLLGGALDVIDALSTTLGQHHDLVVLRMAAAQGQLQVGSDELAEFNALIGDRLAELERDAFELGRQIYAETPGALARRIMAYWRSAPR
jgi:hypothetical protein